MKLKLSLSSLFFILVFQFSAYSQVAIKLKLNKSRYILYENIFATLQIKNLTANPLIFSSSDKACDSLSFVITDRNGRLIEPRKKNLDFLAGTIIKEGEITELTLSLSAFYKINSEGYYTVKAVVRHPDIPRPYQSRQKNFTVVTGKKIWETVVGVPSVDSLEGDKKIHERKYEIRSYFNGKFIIYCLMVSDDDYVYGVAEIGVDSGIKKPECVIDRHSRLHVLVQNSTGYFVYYIYDINCNLDDKEVYQKTKTIPSLSLDDKTGNIEVAGGKRVALK